MHLSEWEAQKKKKIFHSASLAFQQKHFLLERPQQRELQDENETNQKQTTRQSVKP